MGSNFTPLTMDSALMVNMGGRGGSASPYDKNKKIKKIKKIKKEKKIVRILALGVAKPLSWPMEIVQPP
jgi:hypothetical protein